jgi:LuxR family maltose regulon positive regulatory protein
MSPPEGLPQLTTSERRLLPLLATPLSFEEIARLLEIPRDHVRSEAISIYRKLGVTSEDGGASGCA